MKLRTLSGSVAVAALLYAILTWGLPAYQETGGTKRSPHLISLRVIWPGRNVVPISWHVGSLSGATVREGDPTGTGGLWHEDVTVPGRGVYQVILVATPAAIQVHTPEGNFLRSTMTTCTVVSVNGTVKNVAPAKVGVGCQITTNVTVPA